jgi:hypothetical protein
MGLPSPEFSRASSIAEKEIGTRTAAQPSAHVIDGKAEYNPKPKEAVLFLAPELALPPRFREPNPVFAPHRVDAPGAGDFAGGRRAVADRGDCRPRAQGQGHLVGDQAAHPDQATRGVREAAGCVCHRRHGKRHAACFGAEPKSRTQLQQTSGRNTLRGR